MNPNWQSLPFHRNWLMEQASALFDFHHFNGINPKGGFFDLDDDGQPIGNVRQLHATTRMVHCYAIGQLLGRPGSAAVVDHGMQYLWNHHRDKQHGGYGWSLDDDGFVDSSKQAYGHAFVLLAAAGAKMIGHPLADKMLADVTTVLENRFWEEDRGAVREEFNADWSSFSAYRGQNSNMHLTESLMAAFEATGEQHYLRKAERIADLIIGRHAAQMDYRVVEHFNAEWQSDTGYVGSEIFRPSGSTPGHWLEWARLLMQLWVLGGKSIAWLPTAAAHLFRQSIALGWDREQGGFFYTLDWNNQPLLRQKLWWPACEGIGAAATLAAHFDDDYYQTWYRNIWDYCSQHFIDHQRGGWLPQASSADQRQLFAGKPDIYHALQACLIPLYPAEGSLTRVISQST